MKVITVAAGLWAAVALGQVPSTVAYQGTLATSDGKPVVGIKSMTYSVYASANGGSPLWQEVQQVTLTPAGEYALYLGTVTPFPATLFSGQDLWLEIAVDAMTLSPRQRVTSVPYALMAGSAAVTAGPGLNGNGLPGSPLSVGFAGTGAANTAARSDHTHTNMGTITGVNAGTGLNGGGTSGNVSLSVNYGVFGQCSGTSKVTGIDSSTGMVVCAADLNSGGTGSITAVTAGTGLLGGGSTGNVTLGVNYGAFGQCTGSQKVIGISALTGAVVCGADNDTGTITGVTAGSGLLGGGTSGTVSLNVNYGAFGQCLGTQKVSGVNAATGAVVCAADIDTGITGVTAGSGLTGGGNSGTVSLNVNYSAFGQCTGTQKVTGINPANGAVVCGVDTNSGGTLTGITVGAGLNGGGISGNVPMSVDFSVFGQCPGTQKVTGVNPVTGVVTCAVDQNSGGVTQVNTGTGLTGGPITATGTVSIAPGGVTGTELAAGAVGTAQLADAGITFAKWASNGCAAGQIPKWSGTDWTCAADNAGGTAPGSLTTYTVVLTTRTAADCPTSAGFTATPFNTLMGGDNHFFFQFGGGGGHYLGGMNSINYGGVYLYADALFANFTNTTAATICWQNYQTLGNPLTHMIDFKGSTPCPSGYLQIPASALRGNNGYTYNLAGKGGFFLGYVDAWAHGASGGDAPGPQGGWSYRYWSNTLGGDVDNVCLKVMGVESDPATRFGVYPVMLGVKGPAVCPTASGYTYRAHLDARGADDNSYLLMNDNVVSMGGLYTWGHGGENYSQVSWTSGTNSNYCWKFYPKTGKATANIQALNGQNCPADNMSLNVSDVNGSGATVYVQRTGSSTFIGGLNSWARQSYNDGWFADYVTTNANRVCYKVENATWP